MGLNVTEYPKGVKKAVKRFWTSRESASQKQTESGHRDQGERAGVTAGKNMDGFLEVILKTAYANGLAKTQVYTDKALVVLPGYFRPTKLWDLVIVSDGILVAALEFKSQVGPSFGNNFNNRCEEAIGSAHDIWIAYRENAFGAGNPKPFIGWIMHVEDCPKSQNPIHNPVKHFDVFSEFKDASYIRRYEILCQKLVQENLYTSTALVTSQRTAKKTGAFSEGNGAASIKSFIATFAGHCAAIEAGK